MRPALARWLGPGLCAMLLALSACGGGGGGSAQPGTTVDFPPSAASLNDANVTAMVVRQGPQSNVNIPYVSVTVCVPGSSVQCQTIDNVMVDTGSIGLRLFASQINPSVPLPAQTIGGSSQITECAQFLSTLAWGAVKRADVVIHGERAGNVPIQLMDASSFPTSLRRSDLCGAAPLLDTSTNAAINAHALSANGILGVGLFAYDRQIYYNCAAPAATPSGATCQLKGQSYPTAAQQVQNPVGHFSVNNNGVLLQLPAVGSSGASTANGYLIFGIGTQANNRLGSANILQVTSAGQFTTVYNGLSLANSIMDSGSNALYFDDTALGSSSCNTAAGFYCPVGTRSLTASIRLGGSAGTISVPFAIANADNLFSNGNNYAFGNLGGSFGGPGFDWGLPFFYGRSVYSAIEGKNVSTGSSTLVGPFHAFTN